MHAPSFKQCGSCRQIRVRTSFNRHDGTLDGLQPYCYRCQRKANVEHNPQRVFIATKYVGMSHHLGLVGGSYRSWEHAGEVAAQQLHGNELAALNTDPDNVVGGFVYVITNPAWPRFVKIGCAVSAMDRCRSFQTGDPKRAYQLATSCYYTDRRAAEKLIHDLLAIYRAEGEWFRIEAYMARAALLTVKEHLK